MANFKELMRSFLYEEVDDDDDDDEYEDEAGAGFTVTTETVHPASAQNTSATMNPNVNVAGMNTNAGVNMNGADMANPANINSAASMDLAAQQAAMQAAAMQQRALQEQMAKIQAEQAAAQAAAQAASMAQLASAAAPDRSFGLSMDQVGRPDNREEAKPYRYDRRKLQTVRQKTVTTEYQAVLSPIFGNIDDDEKSYNSVHDAINLPRPETVSEITSIISPMYGSTAFAAKARKQKEAEPVPEYKPRRKKAAPSKEEKSGPKDLADYLTKEPISIPRPNSKSNQNSSAEQTVSAQEAADHGAKKEDE